jgi:hypothetical protein
MKTSYIILISLVLVGLITSIVILNFGEKKESKNIYDRTDVPTKLDASKYPPIHSPEELEIMKQQFLQQARRNN